MNEPYCTICKDPEDPHLGKLVLFVLETGELAHEACASHWTRPENERRKLRPDYD